jgi:hypothetical protein
MMSAADYQLVARVARVVAAIVERTDARAPRLRPSSPPGPPDRNERFVLEWLRRWHPRPAHLLPPACSGATGDCLVLRLGHTARCGG